MAFPKETVIKAWSFSRYSKYNKCPLSLKLSALDKLKEPGSAAMDRGTAIHDLAEGYIKGAGRNVPKELKQFADLFKALRRQYKAEPETMVVEDNWAFTKTWKQTQWNDWDNCWTRIKLDCARRDANALHRMQINDWKTGKYRDNNNAEYVEQLELYATAALTLFTDVTEVMPRLVYLDAGVVFPEPGSLNEKDLTFTRKDLPRLKKLWGRRVKPMLTDKVFAPRPNWTCAYCHFRKSNGVTDARGKPVCEY